MAKDPRRIIYPEETEITMDLINELYDLHATERSRIKKLRKYYNNENEIMNRIKKDSNKPNNKIAHNYAAYITDNYVGYMLGVPITYKSNNSNLVESINAVNVYNDVVDHDTSIGQDQSICGYAYELLYTDEDANLRFTHVNTEDMIVVYDNTLEKREMFAIRIVEDSDDGFVVEVIDNERRISYSGKNGKVEAEVADSEVTHNLGFVPICTYDNNNSRTGDFEKVLPLIDAYDQSQSDTANDFEYFTDCLLVISGAQVEEYDEDGNKINFKDDRVLNFLDKEGDAKYLIKNINDAATENYKKRLNQDIHKFSNVIDLSDENFASNLSGVAIQFKLTGMENKTAIKANKFRKGLMKRIEIITNYANTFGTKLDLYTDITPVFTRNIPSNAKELVDIAKSLYGILSDETVISMIPSIEDPASEIEKIKKQKKENMEELDEYSFTNEANSEDKNTNNNISKGDA